MDFTPLHIKALGCFILTHFLSTGSEKLQSQKKYLSYWLFFPCLTLLQNLSDRGNKGFTGRSFFRGEQIPVSNLDTAATRPHSPSTTLSEIIFSRANKTICFTKMFGHDTLVKDGYVQGLFEAKPFLTF